MANNFIFCPHCGKKNERGAKFCRYCGSKLVDLNDQQTGNGNSTKGQSSNPIGGLTKVVNNWTGEDQAVSINLRSFFSQVFKSHTTKEAEEIFIVGTDETTPSLEDINAEEVHPWLFSRILVFVLILAVLMYLSFNFLHRLGFIYALEISVAIAVPLASFVLFFESNVLKNISLYRAVIMFLLGGLLSLLATGIINIFMPDNGTLDLITALGTGFAEELAKVLVAAYFVNKNKAKGILNGLLIGASIGAGFAAFENIMYLFNDKTGALQPLSEAFTRSWAAIADHTEWCAITTAALIMVAGGQKIVSSDFFKTEFLKFFILVMLIHTCWDWTGLDNISAIRYVVLIVLTWIVIFVMLHAGLREVPQLKQAAEQQDRVSE